MSIDASAKHYRRLLVDLDITNREAARLAGVTESSLYRWLSGESPVPHSVIRFHEAQKVIKDLRQAIERADAMIGVAWAEPQEETRA